MISKRSIKKYLNGYITKKNACDRILHQELVWYGLHILTVGTIGKDRVFHPFGLVSLWNKFGKAFYLFINYFVI
ncbi:hypothetical protein BpHYR1_023268 [Brachionus plicatilis]|uniref:Uncharacterized protein n=1 Tax=Brachionus plicatilis TaxID=10195 RepID=A0A3M7QVV7_BRAPC|nr:hypothetical protein BpHYR1_023268 [Brachionus plicatilis]